MPDNAPDRSLEELERIINTLRLARYAVGIQKQMLDSTDYDDGIEVLDEEIAAFEAKRDELLEGETQ